MHHVALRQGLLFMKGVASTLCLASLTMEAVCGLLSPACIPHADALLLATPCAGSLVGCVVSLWCSEILCAPTCMHIHCCVVILDPTVGTSTSACASGRAEINLQWWHVLLVCLW
jgi:hypothetical protein